MLIRIMGPLLLGDSSHHRAAIRQRPSTPRPKTHALRLRHPMQAGSRPSMVAPVGGDAAQLMVGRDRELARVALFLDDALAGRGRLVLCTGEAGIGKTRLAEEAAVLAAARDVPVAWARAADPGSSPP